MLQTERHGTIKESNCVRGFGTFTIVHPHSFLTLSYARTDLPFSTPKENYRTKIRLHVEVNQEFHDIPRESVNKDLETPLNVPRPTLHPISTHSLNRKARQSPHRHDHLIEPPKNHKSYERHDDTTNGLSIWDVVPLFLLRRILLLKNLRPPLEPTYSTSLVTLERQHPSTIP